jgi:hypothetical protein
LIPLILLTLNLLIQKSLKILPQQTQELQHSLTTKTGIIEMKVHLMIAKLTIHQLMKITDQVKRIILQQKMMRFQMTNHLWLMMIPLLTVE